MAELMLVNPRKRRRKTSTRKRRKTSPRRRRRNPVGALAANPKRRRSRRRNPVARGGIKGIVKNSLMPSATAAFGGMALDLIMGYIPLPANLKAGPVNHVVKGAGAIALGMLASNVVSKRTAELFTTGALTITMYNAGKEAVNKFAPGIGSKMAGLGYYEEDLMGLGYAGSGLNVGTDDYWSDDSMGLYDNGMGIYDEMGSLSIDSGYDEIEL